MKRLSADKEKSCLLSAEKNGFCLSQLRMLLLVLGVDLCLRRAYYTHQKINSIHLPHDHDDGRRCCLVQPISFSRPQRAVASCFVTSNFCQNMKMVLLLFTLKRKRTAGKPCLGQICKYGRLSWSLLYLPANWGK